MAGRLVARPPGVSGAISVRINYGTLLAWEMDASVHELSTQCAVDLSRLQITQGGAKEEQKLDE